MKAETLALVQEQYDALKPDLLALVETFYEVLFERSPELWRLFPADLTAQYAHFASTLEMALDNLGRFPAVDETLRQLGVKHMHWGVQPQHYALARDAFLTALERHSGERWTPAVARAWSMAFGTIASAMLRGAALETATIADQLATEDAGEKSDAPTRSGNRD